MAILLDFSFLISSVIQKYIAHDTVTTNGISLMYIISASRDTFLCHSSIPVGRSSATVTTQAVFVHFVLPWSDPTSMLKMSSVCFISAFVTGQFGIIFLSVYLIKSRVLGQPVIFCRESARTASDYSLMVYWDLLLSAVLIMMWATSFLTSEKNSRFWRV